MSIPQSEYKRMVQVFSGTDVGCRMARVRLDELPEGEEESIVRIDKETMKTLEVTPGDKINVRPLVLTVADAHPQDEGKGIARVSSKVLDKIKVKPKTQATLMTLLSKVVIEVKSIRGGCSFGLRPGDIFEFYGPPVSRTNGFDRLCPSALYAIWPSIVAARKGAGTLRAMCPDFVNQTLFEIRRERIRKPSVSLSLLSL